MEKHSLVRTIYLYLFTLLGLSLLIIGGVGFLDMGLKTFVFTKAEKDQMLSYDRSPEPYNINIKTIEKEIEKGKEVCLSEEEKKEFNNWLVGYNDWEKRRSEVNYITSRRHKDASRNLAFILIGLPLYFYHWRTIKKETKNKEKIKA